MRGLTEDEIGHWRRAYELSGMPMRYWASLEAEAREEGTGWRETRAIEQLVKEDEKEITVLAGPVGVGKTMAACIYGASRLWSETVRFVSMPELILWSGQDALNDRLSAPTFILDDLGIELSDDRGRQRALVEYIITSRYDRGGVTVITTNLNAAAFKVRYGERVTDRLRETGRFVELSGRSLRISDP